MLWVRSADRYGLNFAVGNHLRDIGIGFDTVLRRESFGVFKIRIAYGSED